MASQKIRRSEISVDLDQSRSKGGSGPRPRSTCLYCNVSIPDNEWVHHLSWQHSLDQFHCHLCQLNCHHFYQIKDHFQNEHPDLLGVSLAALMRQGKLILPKDLRSLKCRLCRDRYFLSQDRIGLRSHLKRTHGIQTRVVELKYECRLCHKEYPETESFLQHGCCEANGQDQNLPSPLLPEWGPPRKKINQGRINWKALVLVDPSALGQDTNLMDCVYCRTTLGASNTLAHKKTHAHLEFACKFCSKSDADLQPLQKHLVLAHQHNHEEVMNMTPVELCQDGYVVFPKDLRSSKCPLCEDNSKRFLAQSKARLLEHLERLHQGFNVDHQELKYQCRACQMDGFDTTQQLQSHDCGRVSLGEMVFKNLVHVHYETPSIEGDVRWLICKLCAFQVNGVKFLDMIKHLSKKHNRHDDSRHENLENYVRFGCARCPDLELRSTLQWDQHFSSDYSTCVAEHPELVVARTAMEPSSTQGSEPRGNPKTKIAEEDIRIISCTFCERKIVQASFGSMTMHLEGEHKEEIRGFESNLHLFVRFECAKCPGELVAENLPDWEKHFLKRYEECVVSFEKYSILAQELEGTTDLPDLRLLKCQSCQFECNSSKFSQIWSHLESEHKLNEVDYESAVQFGCLNCPNFQPPSLVIWDRHFSSTYKLCQGSSTVPGKRVRYWCDACCETRQDFEQHFKGETHKQSIAEKNKNELLTCTTCDIKVTTEANLKLHTSGLEHGGAKKYVAS